MFQGQVGSSEEHFSVWDNLPVTEKAKDNIDFYGLDAQVPTTFITLAYIYDPRFFSKTKVFLGDQPLVGSPLGKGHFVSCMLVSCL